MKFNDLKRKAFFWIDRLQISRGERISISVLLGILVVLFTLNFFLGKTFNYSQEKYDAIMAEFDKRSAQLHQEQKELDQKYNPELAVSDAPVSTKTELSGTEADLVSNEPDIGIININNATSAELQSLNGIGEAYAQRIIEYREANGGFDSIEELLNVKGIGEKRLDNIRPFITLDDKE